MESQKLTFADSFWRAPLVPVALVVTAGIIADRQWSLSLPFSIVLGLVCLLAWAIALLGSKTKLPLVYLALAGFALGAAYHHYRRDIFPANDIRDDRDLFPDKDINDYTQEKPPRVRLRGVLEAEPFIKPGLCHPLRLQDRPDTTTSLLQVTHLLKEVDWIEKTGLLQVVVFEKEEEHGGGCNKTANEPRLQKNHLEGLHYGDTVEVIGQLARIPAASNPGQFNWSGYWRDQGVRAQLFVDQGKGGIVRLERSWPWSLRGWLGAVHAWGQRQFTNLLAPESDSRGTDEDQHGKRVRCGLAIALVLGEGDPLSQADWAKYKRTGVIHVLVVSGQHLVILAAFLWWALRRLNIRPRYIASAVAIFLLLYVLLTGGRPPGMRSAVAVCVACGAIILRRRVVPANVLALAWLVVALLNPMDLFTPGCQLSFLSVMILYRFALVWQRSPDEFQQLIEESRPAWERCLRGFCRGVLECYLVSVVVWLAVTPLVAYHYHIVPFVALLLGPPLTLLTSIALLSGFALLGLAGISFLIRWCVAPVIDWSIWGCDFLVDQADRPYCFSYVSDIPDWWVIGFYLGLIIALTHGALWHYWRWAVLAGISWFCLGLLCTVIRLPVDEFRCTFLDVGHGGCTVLETPDGQTILYDAGAKIGPQVVEGQIAPFLWHRGIRRIDEVILSHADLDHFNGVEELLKRFTVGQVTYTPTFEDKHAPGVTYILQVLQQQRIPIRQVKAGDRLIAGQVIMEVLHPPALGPEGNENTRSLVLRINHARQTILLTGDLEGKGIECVLSKPTPPIDVFMAPHHGSHRLDAEGLVKWARPWVIISSQGPPLSPKAPPVIYGQGGRHFFSTWKYGAITVRSHSTGLVVETYLGGQRLARPAPRPEPPRQQKRT